MEHTRDVQRVPWDVPRESPMMHFTPHKREEHATNKHASEKSGVVVEVVGRAVFRRNRRPFLGMNYACRGINGGKQA